MSPDLTAPPMPDGLPGRAAPGSTVRCPLPYGLLAIEGADATTFLQGQLSNDVGRLQPGRWQYTTHNSPKGRMLASLILWPEASGFRALLPLDIAEPIRKRLAMYVLRSKVTVADITAGFARAGLAGPGVSTLVREAFGTVPATGEVLAAGELRVVAMAADRFIVTGHTTAVDALRARLGTTITDAEPATWEWLLIRAGVPTITALTQDQFVLQATNLDALGAVSFDKGCYTGQEIIARTQYLGRLKERLYAWHAQEPVGIGTKLYSGAFGDQACGTVVNAAPAPGGGTDLLAVVQIAAVDANDVRVGTPEGAHLAPVPLPYALPQPSSPPRRLS